MTEEQRDNNKTKCETFNGDTATGRTKWQQWLRDIQLVLDDWSWAVMTDDVLDLFGNKGRSEVGTDLKEGKISALVAQHLELHPGDSEELLALLKTPREQTSDAAVEDMIERFRSGGALLKVCENILKIHREACGAEIVQENEGVKDLMETLTAVILSPVEHVFKELGLSGQ